MAVLYLPAFHGFDVAPIRTDYRAWVSLVTLAAVVLFVVRAAAMLLHSGTRLVSASLLRRLEKPPPSLRLTVNSQVNTTWWSMTQQQDGTVVTQMSVEFFAHNFSEGLVFLRSARLIIPRVRLQDMLPTVLAVSDPNGSNQFSSRHFLRPRGNASVLLVMMMRRAVGRPGSHLRAVFGITDQNGCEYRVKVNLWPMGQAISGPTSV
jgi:hypothetical protein